MGKSSQFNLILTDEDREVFRSVAKAHNLTVSACIRRCMTLLYEHKCVMRTHEVITGKRTVVVETAERSLEIVPAPVTEAVRVSRPVLIPVPPDGEG